MSSDIQYNSEVDNETDIELDTHIENEKEEQHGPEEEHESETKPLTYCNSPDAIVVNNIHEIVKERLFTSGINIIDSSSSLDSSSNSLQTPLFKIVGIIMECIEEQNITLEYIPFKLTGTQKKELTISTLKLFIQHIQVSTETKNYYTALIDAGVVDNVITVIVDASKGKFNINTIKPSTVIAIINTMKIWFSKCVTCISSRNKDAKNESK